ncbi:MAG: type II toxin-antitoxin system RelE/ParE family toxin [Acidiferrobacteraceae bacterium]
MVTYNAVGPGNPATTLHYMEVFGPDLGMPHTRAMGGGLFELRLKAAEGIAWVFYCTVADRRIVMLHQFVKKSDKTPRQELDITHKRIFWGISL